MINQTTKPPATLFTHTVQVIGRHISQAARQRCIMVRPTCKVNGKWLIWPQMTSKFQIFFKFELDVHDYVPEIYNSANFHFILKFSGDFSRDRWNTGVLWFCDFFVNWLYCIFTARRTQCVSAVFAIKIWLSGWLDMWMSNAGIVFKRLKISISLFVQRTGQKGPYSVKRFYRPCSLWLCYGFLISHYGCEILKGRGACHSGWLGYIRSNAALTSKMKLK